MTRVFVDTDIVLDLLVERRPFYGASAALFSLADQKELEICVSALCFSNIHYMMTRLLSAAQSRKQLSKFKTLVRVLSVNDKIIGLALSSDFKDFEDAIQYFTALENGITTLLTRNLKDYKTAGIPVMTAQQFLTIHR